MKADKKTPLNSPEILPSGSSSLPFYWKLFTTSFLLSACTFGGGFVIITMMKRKFVEEYHWLKEDEMLDLTAIAQSSPGPLAVNASIVVGYRLKKVRGALAATLGTILPPLLIISILSLCYNYVKDNPYVAIALKVMRAGVAAVILDVVWSLARNVIYTKSLLWIAVMIISFLCSYVFGVDAIIIILACAGIGLANTLLKPSAGKKTSS